MTYIFLVLDDFLGLPAGIGRSFFILEVLGHFDNDLRRFSLLPGLIQLVDYFLEHLVLHVDLFLVAFKVLLVEGSPLVADFDFVFSVLVLVINGRAARFSVNRLPGSVFDEHAHFLLL